jgi:signal transduction histidine kinase
MAQEPGKLLVLDKAEMRVDISRQVPPADAHWEPVALPLFRTFPPGARVVWYRFQFELGEKPSAAPILYARRLGVYMYDIYLNGQPLALSGANPTPGTFIVPLLWRLPLDLLYQGRNVLYLRVVADSSSQGVPRFYLGPAGEMRARADIWRLLQSDIIMIFAFAFGMIGLLSLALWPAERNPALLWYGVTGVAFGLVTLLWYYTRNGDFRELRGVLVFLRFFGFITPIAIMQLRMSGRRWPWVEALLWTLLATATVSTTGFAGPSPLTVWNVAIVAYPALLFVCSLALLWPAAPVAPSTRLLLLGAGLVSAALGVHDALMRMEYLDFDGPWLFYYLIPVYLVGAGAAIVERFVAQLHQLRRSRGELEERVAQKTREIEATQARLAAQERERALAGERRRIMADMHDVLGLRLVGLLSLVQSGLTDRERLEQELAASLDELRMTIDSVQPVEGDLGVVLGNVRHRMRSVFGATGVTLDWRVAELPPMEGLTPVRVLAIQRLLLEVFSNVLKHSGAQTVRVSAARADGSALIAIEDDGRGFELRECTSGRGLANLAARAREAGGSLEISSVTGGGTRVTLALPLGGSAPG